MHYFVNKIVSSGLNNSKYGLTLFPLSTISLAPNGRLINDDQDH